MEETTKLYWSGRYEWRYGEKGILIGNKEYDFRQLFPELYFLTAVGCTLAEAVQHFPDVPECQIRKIFGFLLDHDVLTDTLQTPEVLFESQYRFYSEKNGYPEDILLRNDLIEKIHQEALNRSFPDDADVITLLEATQFSSKRRSVRMFRTDKKISFSDFSALLSCLKQDRSGDQPVCTYPSAGGLYPVDVYLYLKPDRVEGIEGGIYEYLPAVHSLRLVSRNAIPARAHFYGNKQIFASSAFSAYFFYHADASMPKYHGMGYYYAIVDSGIMLGKLTDTAENLSLGSCIIGVFDYSKAADCFQTGANVIYLHCMEFGIPAE